MASEAILATDDNMPFILGLLEAADEIAIDTETSGLDVRNGVDYLTGICFAVQGAKGYIPFRHNCDNVSKRWVEYLTKILQHKPLIWHNRKFDFHSLKTLGMDPLTFVGPQYDVLMIAHLINEELYSKELNFLGKWYLKEEKVDSDEIHKLGEIYGWANIPPNVLYRYGAGDAELTRLLKLKLWPMLVSQGLESVYWDTESPFTTLLYKMEQRGVGVNTELASRMAERGRARMATIQRGFRFNPGSSTDLGNYLLGELGLPVLAHTDTCDKCKRGEPVGSHEWKATFKKTVMEDYDDILQASNNPAAKLIAEYRGWQKATTSLYEPLLHKVGPDGRIRTNFKQHGTVTGRLSSEDPNLQQIPRGSKKLWNGNAKSCFPAGIDGYGHFGWDYSQIEFRLSAAYGREMLLIREFDNPKADPFNLLLPLVFGNFPPEEYDEYRYQIKHCLVYPSLYGAGFNKVRSLLNRSEADALKIYNNYKKSIPGITEVARTINDGMAQQGYISYWDGRRRHIRNRSDTHKAWNSVIQGGAAQIVKQAMLRVDTFSNDDCFPVLTVHDEISFCIRREALPDYEPRIVRAMTTWPDFPVKFAVEGKEWK